MRAKSIKNKARVNAELSINELKNLLKKSKNDLFNSRAYIGLLEIEINIWRNGGEVDRESWATMEKALGLAPGELEKLVGGPNSNSTTSSSSNTNTSMKIPPRQTLTSGISSTSSSNPTSRSQTPLNPLLERIGESGELSRPMTPSGGSSGGGFVDKDEREEFFRRENELGDQLARTVGCFLFFSMKFGNSY